MAAGSSATLSASPSPGPSAHTAGSVLFVDDDSRVLSSLRRLSRRLGLEAHVAVGGAEGLTFLESHDVDIVVSDMRMPAMNGAEFLGHVASRWPQTVRILLTAYSDIESAAAAINHGQPFRYVTKPWDDAEFSKLLFEALEVARLRSEKADLERQNREQTASLQQLNAVLESRVDEKTAELQAAAKKLRQANREIEAAYGTTVEVFASLVQSGVRDSTCVRRLARLARATARHAGLDEDQVRHIHLAGVLCDLGKLTLPRVLLEQPVTTHSADEATEYRRHPLVSESLLLPIKPLEKVATILRSHCERVDGKGFPDGLEGDSIPIGSRILCVIKDYDALMSGLIVPERMTSGEARNYLREHAGTRYDKNVLASFLEVLDEHLDTPDRSESRLPANQLQPGMVISRDLMTRHGALAVPAGMVLDAAMIAKLKRLAGDDSDMTFYVRPGDATEAQE